MVLSDYRDGRLSTVDTNDLIGILMAFLGGSIITQGLPEIFQFVFANYSYTVGGVTFGLGLVMIISAVVLVYVTNDLKSEEMLDINQFEGLMVVITALTTVVILTEPQFVINMIFNNQWGQIGVTGLYTTVVSLLATQ